MTPASTTGRKWKPLAYHETGQWPKGWREVKGWYVTKRGRIGFIGTDNGEENIDIGRWRWARDPCPQIPSLFDLYGKRHTSIAHKYATLVVDEHNRLITISPIFE